jgi:hypothetical protein
MDHAPRGRDDDASTRWAWAFAWVIVVCAIASPASAIDFKPFTDVENVCPDCSSSPFDTVTLQDGSEIRANIVAENSDFFVLERFGEVRAISHDRVESTSWADGRPSNLNKQDQIVLQNGHVFTGTIVDRSDKPGHMQLDSSIGETSYVVFETEIEALYRQGKRQELSTSSKSSGASTSTSGSTSESSGSTSNETSESNDSSSTSEGSQLPDASDL